jgi:DNA (cytosine-5)-methyltransferase 1
VADYAGLGLCAGGLGLELGVETALPGYRTVCLVEREASVVGRMAARMAEGSIAEVPVWSDITTFDGKPWRGIVHLVTAGFPCQPFSVAGKRAGTSDIRWIWPDIARIIGEVEPEICFLENVPGLLLDPAGDFDRWALDEFTDDAIGGMGTVLRDLAGLGFSAEWGCLRASDVGASHGRKRVFILAYRERARCDGGAWAGRRTAQPSSLDECGPSSHDCGTGGILADAASERLQERGNDSGLRQHAAAERTGNELGDAAGGRFGVLREPSGGVGFPDGSNGGISIFAPGPESPNWENLLVQRPWLRPSWSQTEAESNLCNLVDGVASLVAGERTGALRALGNGVVPLQAALAFVLLARRAVNTLEGGNKL